MERLRNLFIFKLFLANWSLLNCLNRLSSFLLIINSSFPNVFVCFNFLTVLIKHNFSIFYCLFV
ncbi:hypothetical protein A8E62_32215 [Burkholderia cenocepacia]|uniref:Uncharacterized protein n=1 Tax=Burkholderia cenocepacia TaxID=95486 RepID=A0A1V2VTT6_9BURK|nr:hypothetical protein A8E62_32215 [Burkholderia cenocepacia]ONU56304.1 hypothetical protein A8E67_25205 [Burkholderia cenocepacia]ONU61894.1 hypothetical protein A8E68_16440 [Burkholderia cenocepacia]ONU76301.1 hypothetical protein A8E72_33860 [Burkholderia cenocepacia]ONU79531.1 hypothetical protein A8E73_22300 [Burkholderia cenocepacia]